MDLALQTLVQIINRSSLLVGFVIWGAIQTVAFPSTISQRRRQIATSTTPTATLRSSQKDNMDDNIIEQVKEWKVKFPMTEPQQQGVEESIWYPALESLLAQEDSNPLREHSSPIWTSSVSPNSDIMVPSLFICGSREGKKNRIKIFDLGLGVEPEEACPTTTFSVDASNALVDAVQQLRAQYSDPETPFRVTLPSIDRRLRPWIETTLSSELDMELEWDSPCGHYHHPRRSSNTNFSQQPTLLPSQYQLRRLTVEDAPLVNDRWAYRSDSSLARVQRMIKRDDLLSLGIEHVGSESGSTSAATLVAWILQYPEGGMGMLWTEPDHRRLGLA